jgi:hypothetical protein
MDSTITVQLMRTPDAMSHANHTILHECDEVPGFGGLPRKQQSSRFAILRRLEPKPPRALTVLRFRDQRGL